MRVPVDAVPPTTQCREPVAAPCRTADQQRAVDAVVRVVTGHRRRPVVLTSDRGRGKSAAFGIAAAQLTIRAPGPVADSLTGQAFEAIRNETAVRRLRERKRRAEKPFAVMFPDLEALLAYAETLGAVKR